jgi:hypothetical protein
MNGDRLAISLNTPHRRDAHLQPVAVHLNATSRTISREPEDVAAELDVLASRVRRLSPPLASNPHRFHEERSEIAKRSTHMDTCSRAAMTAASLLPRNMRF